MERDRLREIGDWRLGVRERRRGGEREKIAQKGRI
jgi:hypothetical protein